MKYTAKDINKVKGSTIVFFFITCIVLVVALLFVFHILSFDIINNLAGREAFKAGSGNRRRLTAPEPGRTQAPGDCRHAFPCLGYEQAERGIRESLRRLSA